MICIVLFFFFKQKTAYEMRISDWSSDVCSSDLGSEILRQVLHFFELAEDARDVGKDRLRLAGRLQATAGTLEELQAELLLAMLQHRADRRLGHVQHAPGRRHRPGPRWEERREGKGGGRTVKSRRGAVAEKQKQTK